MELRYEQKLVQTQKLVLTPELKQSLEILQMNSMKLGEFLRQEAQENPLLELTEQQDWEEAKPEETDCDENDWKSHLWELTGSLPPPKKESPADNRIYYLDNITLREHLTYQIGMIHLTPGDRGIAENIIGNIDDNGYLRCSVQELAGALRSPVSRVKSILAVVQALDPPGVGARDLRECLLLQAKHKGIGQLAETIIHNYLEDLGQGRYGLISKKTKTTVKEVLKARDKILTLSPKPGCSFSRESAGYIVPDIQIRKMGKGFIPILNDNSIPMVYINSFYKKLLAEGDTVEKAYLSSHLKRAEFVIRSIEQRKTTIIKIMEILIELQEQFFNKGVDYLAPITLADIAQKLEMHESTISRALSNKYVDTPFGVFPCKVFFSPGLKSMGEEVSQVYVKRMVREIISQEKKNCPLTDVEISKALAQKGVYIARRTVAKYRSQLGILPANKRRAT